MTNIQNETSSGDERGSNNQETPRGNPEETLDKPENNFDRPKDSLGKLGASQDKPEENPNDQNCKRSPGNLWLSIGHENESLLNRYIRIEGIERRVNDISLNVYKIETFYRIKKSRQKVE